MSDVKQQRKLSHFDVTNLVIGAIIFGADIYVAFSNNYSITLNFYSAYY